MTGSALDRPFGIYEKALPAGSWDSILRAARRAGYDFAEMSIDESDERLSRLDWTPAERRTVRDASLSLDVPIYSICLSGHRRFGLGSADGDVRRHAAQMLDAAIGLACDLGVRVIQIAGYHAYYENPDRHARDRFVDGLRLGTGIAARRGVMLGVENIDTGDTASADDCLALRADVASPWFQIYPDVGNFAVHGLDVPTEMTRVMDAAIGLHLKDARFGEPRRVSFGAGVVPFNDVFGELHQLAYAGPLTVEMWNDDPASAVDTAAEALTWLKHIIAETASEMTGRSER